MSIFTISSFLIINFLIVNSQQQCSFEQDIDYFGNDLSQTPTYAASQDACCALCSANSDCQIWTFVPASTACWLKRSVGSYRVSASGRISGVKQITSSTTTIFPTTTQSYSTCAFEQDIDYFGNDLTSTPSYAVSKDACCAQCQADPNCQIWVFVASTTACWLKRQVGSVRVQSPGRVAGVKQTASTSFSSNTTPTSTTTTTTTAGNTIGGTCSFEQDIDYFGNDLSSSPTYVSSKDSCCALCSSNPNCQIWTFVTSTGACWLKRQVGSVRVASPGRLSGVNQQISSTTASTLTSSAITSSTAAPTCSFEKDVDYFGNDLYTNPVFLTSQDLCCLSCQANPDCQIWTFVTSTNACWLKRQVGYLRISPSPGRNSGVKQSSSTQTTAPSTTYLSTITSTTTTSPSTTILSQCLVEIDVNYPGNELLGKGNVISASECCNLCGSTPGCGSWSYYLAYNYCFLKTLNVTLSSGNGQPYPGIMSGFVNA